MMKNPSSLLYDGDASTRFILSWVLSLHLKWILVGLSRPLLLALLTIVLTPALVCLWSASGSRPGSLSPSLHTGRFRQISRAWCLRILHRKCELMPRGERVWPLLMEWTSTEIGRAHV